jgi:hypothetical protein
MPSDGNADQRCFPDTHSESCAWSLCHAGRDNRECGRLGGSAMIALAIVRTLILALFGLTTEESNERQFSR